MEIVPNIDLDKKKAKKRPLLSFIIYLVLFFSVLLIGDYLFIQKNILKNINPISKMQYYYREKNYSKVIKMGTKLLEKHPKSIAIRRYLWKSYLYTKQFNRSLRMIREMEKIVPHSIEIPLGLCTTFRFMGEYEKTMYWCQKALEIKSNTGAAHDQIIQALVEQKKYGEAINYLNKISEDQTDNLKSLILKSNIASIKGDHEESIKLLEKARTDYPKTSIIYYYLGKNYHALGEHVKAASFLEEFTDSVYHKDVDIELLENAYTNLASCYEKARMFSNAYRAYKNAACFTIKLKETDETIRLMTRAITATYAGYTGFVSQKDFRDKFKKLERELEDKCEAKLFMEETY